MPKYLVKASLTADGAKGTIKEGGTSRRDTVSKMIEGLGGKVEAFYYALGETDAYVIVDAPDNLTVAAVSLTISASGAVATNTVVLLSPEEIDEATKKSVDYRPPGA